MTSRPVGFLGGTSFDRVWIAYRGPVGLAVKKRISFSDDSALTFRHKDLSEDGVTSGIRLAPIKSTGSVLAVVRDVDATGSLKIESKEVIEDPFSGSISLGTPAIVATGAGLGQFETLEDGTDTASTFHLALTSTGVGGTALRACSMNYYADAAGGYSDGWVCGADLASSILVHSDKSTFQLGLDHGRVALVYIPTGASTNAAKATLRLFYDGSWTQERAISSVEADQVSIAPYGDVNRMLVVFRDSTSGGLISDAIDLPALVSPLSSSKPRISRVASCDSTTLTTQSFHEPVTWTLDIVNGTGSLVRTQSWNQAASYSAVAWEWDGRDNAGIPVAEGTYGAVLRVTDLAGWVVTRSSPIINVDLTAPEVNSSLGPFALTNLVVSPNGDSIKDTTKANAKFSEESTATLAFKDSSGNVVRTLYGSKGFALWNGTVGSTGLTWDGKDTNGQVVADGTYRTVLALRDLACNVAVEAGTIDLTVDTVAPTFSQLGAQPDLFSPNGDGVLDHAAVTATLTDPSVPISWEVKVKKQGTVVRSFAGSGGALSQVWDGKDSSGTYQPSGTYAVDISATDAAGNVRLASTGLEIDVTPPTISDLAASPTAFSPGDDGSLDTTYVTATTTDVHAPLTWAVKYRGAQGVVRSISGSGAGISAAWDGRDGDGSIVPDGLYSLDILSTDALGNTRTLTFETQITVDRTGPTVSLQIHHGLDVVYSREATLQMACLDLTACTLMSSSTNGGPASSPEPFAASKSLTLDDADGLQTVSMNVTDALGNPGVGGDDIVVQTSGPTAGLVGGAIIHNPVLTGSVGTQIATSAESYCELATCSMKLFYRTPTGQLGDVTGTALISESGWTAVDGSASDKPTLVPDAFNRVFSFTIPGSAVVREGLDYFLKLTDNTTDPVTGGKYYWPGASARAGYQHVQVGTGPVIAHVAPYNSYAGRPILVKAEITCPGSNCAPKLGYRRVKDTVLQADAFASVDMLHDPSIPTLGTGKVYVGTIPAAISTTKGIDYFIRVTDSQGTSRWPTGIPYHGYGADIGPDGSLATYYRMDVLATPVIAHAPKAVSEYKTALPIKFAANCPTAKPCLATVWYRTTPGSLDSSQVLLGEPTPVCPASGACWVKVDPEPTLPGPIDDPTTPPEDGLTEYLWEIVIPASYVDTRGVDYLIKVTDTDTTMYWPGAPYQAWVGVQVPPIVSYHVHVVNPPVITHVPVVAHDAGRDLKLEWEFLCYASSSSNCRTEAYWRQGWNATEALGARPFFKLDPHPSNSANCYKCSWTVLSAPGNGYVIQASITIKGADATQNSLGYYLHATDGQTNAYMPGTSYQGYVIPVDGVNVGQYEPFVTYLYGPHARSDFIGLEDFYTYRKWDVGTGEAFVNMGTGNTILHYSDMEIPGPGLNLRLTRTYNSQAQTEGPLGKGWTIGFADGDGMIEGLLSAVASVDIGRALEVVGTEDQFDFNDADGTRHHFVKGGPDGPGWHTPPGVNLAMTTKTVSAKTWYVATRPDGVAYEFGPTHQVGNVDKYGLKRITDRANNSLDFAHDTSSGLLLTASDRSGKRKFIFTYVDVAGKKLLQDVTFQNTDLISNPSGKTWKATYSVGALGLSSATEASGVPSDARTTRYSYTTNGIAQVTDARGNVTQFPGWLGGQFTQLIDREGQPWRLSYNPTDCPPQVENMPSGCVVDPQGNKAITTMNSGYNLIHQRDEGELDESGQVRYNSQTFDWVDNRMIRETDQSGNTHVYTYNPRGQISQTTFTGIGEDPVTTRITYLQSDSSAFGDISEARVAAETSEERVWKFEYLGTTGLTAKVTDPLSKATVLTYHDGGDRGLVKSITDRNGNATSYGSSSADYDISGQPRKISDPLGKARTFEYDFMGRQTRMSSRLNKSSINDWDLRGNVIREIDAANNVTRHCFDLNDNEILTVSPKGTALGADCSWSATNGFASQKSMDRRDMLSSEIKYSDGQRRQASYQYDLDGELRSILEPRAGQKVEYQRYNNNRVKVFKDEESKVTQVLYTPHGLVSKVISPSSGAAQSSTKSYTYTGRGHVKSMLSSGHSSAATNSYNRHGELTAVKDPKGNVTTMVYDKLGRVTQSIDAGGRVTSKSYDNEGNLKALDQPTGAGARFVTSYTYTPRDELKTETDASDSTHMIEYVYDDEERQTARIDKKNGSEIRRIAQSWTDDGKEDIRRSTGVGTLSEHKVDFDYDANDNTVAIRTFRDGSSTPNVSSISVGYTGADEIKDWTETIYPPGSSTGVTKSSSFTYWEDGLLKSRTVAGTTTSYDYTLNGHEKKLSPWGSGSFDFEYFDSGVLKKMTMPNGSVAEQTYDLGDRLSSRVIKKSDGTVLSAWDAITYDDNDNRTSELVRQRQVSGAPIDKAGKATYDYDKLNRVTAYTHPFDAATPKVYAYDDGSNAINDGEFTYDFSANRLTKRTKIVGINNFWTYAYDEIGNIKQETETNGSTTSVTNNTYNASGQEIKVDLPGGSAVDVEYQYDGLEKMVARKEASGEVRLFFHDLFNDQIALETDQSGSPKMHYILDADGDPVANHDETASDTSERRGYYVEDPNSNLTQMLAQNQDVVAVFNYDPFGRDKGSQTKSRAGSGTSNWDSRLRFQMTPKDPKTGAYSMGSRQFDPNISRFTAADHYIAAAANLELQLDPLTGNRYLFAGANPVNYFDDGHWPSWKSAKRFAKRAMPALAFVPVVGTAFDLAAAVTGRDYLNGGRKLSKAERLMALGGAVLDVVSGGIAGKALKAGKLAAKAASKADALGAVCTANSFTPETPVLMGDGSSISISEVQIGDWVMATDPATGETGARQVTDVIIGEGLKELVDVTVDGQVITATDGHPFFDAGKGEFVDARYLELGDLLRLADGRLTNVERVRNYSVNHAVVYNLTVDGFHTFYAGVRPVLVHNCKVVKVIGNLDHTAAFRGKKGFDVLRDGANWRENKRWLKEGVSKRQDFRLATDPDHMRPNRGKYMRKEMRYLKRRGYQRAGQYMRHRSHRFE